MYWKNVCFFLLLLFLSSSIDDYVASQIIAYFDIANYLFPIVDVTEIPYAQIIHTLASHSGTHNLSSPRTNTHTVTITIFPIYLLQE